MKKPCVKPCTKQSKHLTCSGKYSVLMQPVCSSRLGGDISDANQIKKHGFFADVVWDDVLNKRVCIQPHYWEEGQYQ